MLAHLLLFISTWTDLSAATAVATYTWTPSPEDDEHCLLQKALALDDVLQARRRVETKPPRDQHDEQSIAMKERSRALHQPNAAMHNATLESSGSTLIERPNAGSGPDLVSFGVFVKGVRHLDMMAGTFTTDTVMIVQWNDRRALSLLPTGRESMTLSKEEFEGVIWLPEVEVTNHIVQGYEIISTGVTVNSSGIITKVERTISIVTNDYKLDDFPWDTQVLTLNVASTTYMSDQVKLIPITDPGISGVDKDLAIAGFDIVSHEVSEAEMVDGPLKKSRGVTEITVHRVSSRYLYQHLVPSVLLLFMTWAGVFGLPLLPSFSMPRLAISVIGFLSLETLNLRVDNLLPPGAPVTWSDIYDQNLQTLFFFILCLNIFAELVMHRMEQKELAKHIQTECGLLLVVESTVTIVAFVCHTGAAGLWSLSLISQIFVVVTLCGYIMWRCLHVFIIVYFEHGSDASASVEGSAKT